MADDDDGQEGIIPARLLRQNYFLPNIRPTSDSSEGKKKRQLIIEQHTQRSRHAKFEWSRWGTTSIDDFFFLLGKKNKVIAPL